MLKSKSALVIVVWSLRDLRVICSISCPNPVWLDQNSIWRWGSKGGAVVRALTSHQYGLGLNPGVDAICGLSLLLVLSLAQRDFFVFKNQHFQIPIRSGTHRHVSASSYELLSDPWVNKLQFTIYNFYDEHFSSETQFCFRTYNTKWHTQMEELQDIALQSKDSLTRKTTNPISA